MRLSARGIPRNSRDSKNEFARAKILQQKETKNGTNRGQYCQLKSMVCQRDTFFCAGTCFNMRRHKLYKPHGRHTSEMRRHKVHRRHKLITQNLRRHITDDTKATNGTNGTNSDCVGTNGTNDTKKCHGENVPVSGGCTCALNLKWWRF